ncbi:hypothetical protein [Rhizobium sp. IMFF44]|uniref:hypothetical protein n=1 Tax=Rhizobium sp. IMFF44 TaxID=3342350 RepID=UPI0035B897EB
MVDYKRLSDEDLSLAIDRAQAAIEGQRLIIAQIAATAAGFQDSAEHRQLVETQCKMRERLASDLNEMETERWRRK